MLGVGLLCEYNQCSPVSICQTGAAQITRIFCKGSFDKLLWENQSDSLKSPKILYQYYRVYHGFVFKYEQDMAWEFFSTPCIWTCFNFWIVVWGEHALLHSIWFLVSLTAILCKYQKQKELSFMFSKSQGQQRGQYNIAKLLLTSQPLHF